MSESDINSHDKFSQDATDNSSEIKSDISFQDNVGNNIPDLSNSEIDSDADFPAEENEPKAIHASPLWRAMVVLSIIITLVAWFAMIKDEYVSFWTGAVGAVVSLLSAIFAGKGIWRDMAITCVIACGILLLVYLIFYTAVNYALKSL